MHFGLSESRVGQAHNWKRRSAPMGRGNRYVSSRIIQDTVSCLFPILSEHCHLQIVHFARVLLNLPCLPFSAPYFALVPFATPRPHSFKPFHSIERRNYTFQRPILTVYTTNVYLTYLYRYAHYDLSKDRKEICQQLFISKHNCSLCKILTLKNALKYSFSGLIIIIRSTRKK